MFANKLAVLLVAAAAVGTGSSGCWSGGGPKPTSAEAPKALQPEPADRSAGPQPTSQPGANRPAQDRALPAAEEAETFAFLKEKRPEYYERLMNLQKEDPRQYRQAMHRMHAYMKRWQDMPQEVRDAANEERIALVRVMDKVRQIRQAKNSEEADKLKNDLHQVVAVHFEAAQKLRERRLAQLETQIRDLRAELNQQQTRREQVIQERMDLWLKATREPEPKTQPGATGASNHN